jgi:hypothetical protein
MNWQSLEIHLEFSGTLTESQHAQIVQNVLDSLIHTVDTAGLVPDDAEQYTEIIKVSDPNSGVRASHNFSFFADK